MISNYIKSSLLFVLLASFSMMTSCKDDPEDENDYNENEYVNSWIYDNMLIYYLWSDDMPSGLEIDTDPVDFFNALIVDQDRFSRIFPDFDALINALNGINYEDGYEFTLASTDGTEVIGIITYVKKNSPASEMGLMRGDRILKINGQSMNTDNYRDIAGETGDAHSIEYSRYDDNLQSYVNQGTVSLAVIEYSENPNFLDSIYSIEDKKIGYYVYHFFSDNGSTSGFDAEMDDIIQAFKNENITDLIVDLRYNGGGYISSARNLASLIGSNITSNDILYEYEFNDLVQSNQKEEDNQERFLTKSQNIGDLISGQVYVLVSGSTASASELVINSLTPFMNVTLVGETTVGKNVGSIPIDDENNDDNKYGLLPIVFYISNSQGFNDYGDGFTPDAQNIVNERTSPMYALGDVREAMLSHTLDLILGNDVVARKRNADGPISVGSSLQSHTRFGNTILSRPISK